MIEHKSEKHFIYKRDMTILSVNWLKVNIDNASRYCPSLVTSIGISEEIM